MKCTCLGIVCIILISPFSLLGQNADSIQKNFVFSSKLSEKYIKDISTRSAACQEKMQTGTETYLNKLRAQEQVIQKELDKINPSEAERIFEGSQTFYDKIQEDAKNNVGNLIKKYGKYVPGIDSAITSLRFFQNPNITNTLGGNTTQLKLALSRVKSLEDEFTKVGNVEDLIKQRVDYLEQQLSPYKLSAIDRYNQQAAYYAQEMNELKQDWEDPSRLETKTMDLLNKLPAFRDFMSKNSAIAGLFNVPTDYTTSGLAGLQNKQQVQILMQQSMMMMGPGGTQTARQNISNAQSSVSAMRQQLNQGSSELAMPAGQGNEQHTKTFLKRIEYGFNVQSTKSTNYFPTQTDFALTAGYKLNPRNTIGIGVSYNVGWGKDIQHISITSQGMGFRTFGDFKVWKSFYATGGFECNYTQPFNSLNQFKISTLWQKSGLVGVTKMVSIANKLVKKTKLQLLWNFLSYYQFPKTQSIIFRVGYNF